ncbi:unnamed protein product, partial [Symbiodinium sp. CCMP2592]
TVVCPPRRCLAKGSVQTLLHLNILGTVFCLPRRCLAKGPAWTPSSIPWIRGCRSSAPVMPSRAKTGSAPSWTSKTGRTCVGSVSLRVCNRSLPGTRLPERSCWKLYQRALPGS